MSDFAVYDGAKVREYLDFPGCISAMREAMAALSGDTREQPLRSIVPIGEHKLFGLMPGVAPGGHGFGAKLVSVFADPAPGGHSRHQGFVALFDGETGALVCMADGHEVTRIRTACASAAATDALARAEASVLAIFGCGTQAEAHIRAIPLIRPIEEILVWGRSEQRAAEFARNMAEETGANVICAPDPRAAAGEADIICTVTGSKEPVLLHDWVRPGTHINAVGSSFAGPVEIETTLVASSRYIVDYRRSALVAAAEFLKARDEGLIDENHIRGEIGEVFSGRVRGRENERQITLYKSLGHIAQDLAAASYIHDRAMRGPQSAA